MNMKSQIDKELEGIYMNEILKKKIRENVTKKRFYKLKNSVAACLILFFFTGITVAAGYHLFNKMMVNDEVLPELDQMYNVAFGNITLEADEDGIVEKTINNYQEMQETIGVSLLDSTMSEKNDYIQGTLMTDKKNFAILTVENYIIGDTSDFVYNAKEDFYSYKHGEEFYSPVSLTVEIMLSEEQMQNGWEHDYLGRYSYVENYVSKNGYKVNVIEDTIEENQVEEVVSEKCMIFVADGIRYTLKGRTSVENMKHIVDTMK